MINIQENINTKNYSTFKIGGQFRYFIEVNSILELKEAVSFSKKEGLSFFCLGGGSNIVFSDGVINKVFLKINLKGFNPIYEDNAYVDIKIGAGEMWDEVVAKTVDMNLSGLEALSFIPGTVGATPVQNVGAYGSEVKDTILEVEVFDVENNTIINLSNEDCGFGYRDSIFKGSARGKYIIVSVTYRLSKSLPSIPKYPGVIKYFEDREISNPTLKEIRDAIIYIRNSKLPNPEEIPNAGSFFKNPIVENKIAEKIKIDFPEAKFFQSDDSHTKIPAGWLIENVGLKGKTLKNISVYNKSALVLVNDGNASFEDLMFSKQEVIKRVNDRFCITLEQEPEIV